MKSYEEMDHHPDTEKLVKILMAKTQNEDALFFRVMVAYYWSMVASMMRTNVVSANRGKIPVNMYAFNLAPSGSGKTLSSNVMEDEVLEQFRFNFTENTFPLLAKRHIPKIAQRRAIRWGTDPDDEEVRANREFETSGPLLFSFDSATVPAIKQARHKLLMANAGSLNLMIDEIGNNLSATKEAFDAFLELFDVGKIKQALRKNTADNARAEEIVGKTPANMMAFGVPTALLNGAKTEEEFYELLATGLARRCFFGYHRAHNRAKAMTAAEMFAQQTTGGSEQFIEDLADQLGDLADMVHANKDIRIEDDVAMLFLEYQIACEAKAAEYPEHEELRQAELSHRHFKSMKMAGAYAFIDGSPTVTEDHAYMAIKLAEESGAAFDQILTRDRPYVKLAKYISAIARPVTQADLVEDLPFYKGTNAQRNDMMSLAIAWGYQNNIVVKKQFNDGVEFLHGETLEKTDLNKLLISWSLDISRNYYADDKATWENLHKMTNCDKDVHWANHHFNDGHRCEDEAMPGFNLIVLDIDDGVPLSTARELLKDYKALFYTTKNHQQEKNGVVCDRFRIVLPTNYKLKLDRAEYKKFMVNLFTWLPFEVDEATKDRSRKWLSSTTKDYFYQDGELLDVLPFIPQTSKNEEFKKRNLDTQGLDNLERWVLNNSGDGNRNVMLHRFAMVLLDAGFGYEDIRQKVNSLNAKMPDKLDEEEIMATVLVTVSKELASRATNEIAA